MSIFDNESSKAELAEITRRIENPAIAKKTELEEVKKLKTDAASSTTADDSVKPATTATGAATAPAIPVKLDDPATHSAPSATKKYVFAFDIDNTLVRTGSLNRTTTRTSHFNTTYATDHDAMLNLMKDMINAGHYVWIVTANTSIAKDTFDTNYLKSDKRIIASKNYYFMNPTTVNDASNEFFDASKISPHLTAATELDLSFSDGNEFQTKGLKPYAMIAKWLQLENPNMNNVQMYLFDDNDGYRATCTNVKDGKIEFVKIGPAPPAPAPLSPAPPLPPKFKSDVLIKATEKFNATKTAVTAGGGNLNVMTFNTWYEAFSPDKYDKTKYCTEDGKNKCTDTIMKTIVDRMKEGGPQVIFLQEFTSRFDEFFTKAGVTIDTPDSFASIKKVDTDIPQLRHFTMTVDGKKFYVYTATIAGETITTIYSSDLCDKSADAFFIGNTATVRKAPRPLDNAPYFWKDKTDTADADSWIFGGGRPYIVLEFKDKKLVLINLHSHHDESFRPKKEGPPFTTDQNDFIDKFKKKDGVSPNSVQTYAFSVLGNMLRDKTRIPNLDEYGIIIGGDFNAEPERTLELLNLSLGTTAKPFTDDGIKRIDLKTCCTTDDGDTFNKAGDQIYSRGLKIVKDSYKVHEANTLTPGTEKSTQKYFSDHLPVYATVTLPSIASVAYGVSAGPITDCP